MPKYLKIFFRHKVKSLWNVLLKHLQFFFRFFSILQFKKFYGNKVLQFTLSRKSKETTTYSNLNSGFIFKINVELKLNYLLTFLKSISWVTNVPSLLWNSRVIVSSVTLANIFSCTTSPPWKKNKQNYYSVIYQNYN